MNRPVAPGFPHWGRFRMVVPARSTLAMLLIVVLGLAAVELWAFRSIYGDQRMGGPVLGAVLIGVLGVLPVLLNKTSQWWTSAAVAALLAVVELSFCVAAVGTVSATAMLLLPAPVADRVFSEDWTTDLAVLTVVGLGLVVAARGWLKFSAQTRRTARATLAAERARAQIAERDQALARSELNLLRAQIEPHFLWNTLAHVQHLTRKSPKDAEAMTGHLICFLRAAVPLTRSDFSTLQAEVASARAYLELMKIRMGGRLSVAVELAPHLADAAFPPLLIQTLVENAIKHGIEPKVGPVSISVRAVLETPANRNAEPQRILVEVVDSGVGLMPDPPTQGTRLGLRNVRERLQLLYPAGASLRIAGAPGGGVVASISVPFTMTHTAP